MKRSRLVRHGAALLVGFALSGASFAHDDHGKPMHGGVVAEAGAFQAELVSSPATVTLHVTEHGAPVPTAGARAKLTVLTGAQKSELMLAPAGGNRLTAPARPFAPGTKVVANVTLADGRSGALRFELK